MPLKLQEAMKIMVEAMEAVAHIVIEETIDVAQVEVIGTKDVELIICAINAKTKKTIIQVAEV